MSDLTLDLTNLASGITADGEQLKDNLEAIRDKINGNINPDNITAIDSTVHTNMSSSTDPFHSAESIVYGSSTVAAALGTLNTKVDITTNTVALTDAFPVTVAHGKSNIPHIKAMYRFKDEGTGNYSNWFVAPFTTSWNTYPGDSSFVLDSMYFEVNATNIIFHAEFMGGVTSGSGQVTMFTPCGEFSASNKGSFLIRDTGGTQVATWDKIEIKYWIETIGV